jgi:hypothetical protein
MMNRPFAFTAALLYRGTALPWRRAMAICGNNGKHPPQRNPSLRRAAINATRLTTAAKIR